MSLYSNATHRMHSLTTHLSLRIVMTQLVLAKHVTLLQEVHAAATAVLGHLHTTGAAWGASAHAPQPGHDAAAARLLAHTASVRVDSTTHTETVPSPPAWTALTTAVRAVVMLGDHAAYVSGGAGSAAGSEAAEATTGTMATAECEAVMKALLMWAQTVKAAADAAQLAGTLACVGIASHAPGSPFVQRVCGCEAIHLA
jgi:hypothetical protein